MTPPNNSVKPSRVILVVLATLVIFAAGVVTGSLVTRKAARPLVTQPMWGRFEMIRRAVGEMDRRGQLTPEQHQRIDLIIRDHQELIADYFSILEPDVQDVFKKLRDSIREELGPEQRRQFEELSRRRMGRPNDRPMDRRSEDPMRGPMQPGMRPGPDGPPPMHSPADPERRPPNR
jgi:Spy/CpxP family protein refolding chaperone